MNEKEEKLFDLTTGACNGSEICDYLYYTDFKNYLK